MKNYSVFLHTCNLKIGQLLKFLIRCVFSPLKNKVYFLFFALLLFLPELFLVSMNERYEYITTHFFNNFTLSFGCAYILCAIIVIANMLSGKLSKVIMIFFHVILYFLSLVDVFLIKIIGCQYSGYIFQLISDTDTRETVGFFSSYVCNYGTLSVVGLFVLIFIFELLLIRSSKIRIVTQSTIKLFFVLYILFQLFEAQDSLTQDLFHNNHVSHGKEIQSTMLYNLNNAIADYRQTSDGVEKVIKEIDNVVVDSCIYKSTNIVLIIGESYIKSHSSLYGYSLHTNPFLDKRIDNGLFIFNDVITAVNRTSEAFQNFLSPSDASEMWYDSPLFPVIFRKAGYKVSFFSNQFLQLEPGKFSSGYCFNDNRISEHLFDIRNQKIYDYDEGILNEYKIDEKDKLSNNNLIIFHLLGQHTSFSDRYPKERTVFASDDVKRSDLDVFYRKEIAEYDNAVVYNDSVVNEIIKNFESKDAIVIYFADHGDEVNDYRLRIGRAVDMPQSGKGVVHCQMDVPLIMYATPLYMRNHPDIVNNIKNAVNRPWMTSDLSHLLFDIAGIYCPYYKPERSVINPSFKVRKRYIPMYDFDYDEVCRN